MPSVVQAATLTSYADDTKVAQAIRNPADAALLQRDLDAIYKWAEDNNMKFNASKFQALHYQPTDTGAPNQGYFGPGQIEIPALIRAIGKYSNVR